MTRIAVVQFAPVFGDVARNVAKTVTAIERAADEGAQVVVLPELSNSGYVFRSRDEARGLSEVIGEGPASLAWAEIAQRRGIVLAAGINERDDDVLYNSAVMYGPSGLLGTYRKLHLWDAEALYFEPGNLGFPVVDTPFGRLGMLICYDGWFPEAYRSLVLQGVDIVCVPTNWVPIPGQQEDRQAMATLLSMANAHINGVAVAAAARTGIEREQEFIGQSIIIGHTGWPLAGPASPTDDALLIAEVDLAKLRESRSWGEFNNPVLDRRPETYITLHE